MPCPASVSSGEDEEGSAGSDGDMFAVARVTDSPFEMTEKPSIESEVIGEVETHRPTTIIQEVTAFPTDQVQAVTVGPELESESVLENITEALMSPTGT